MDPENPLLTNFSEFSFGYTNQGKEYKYKISMNPQIADSGRALHMMFWAIRDSKRGSYLPWPHIPEGIKSKLIVSNPDDPQASFLPELLSKVATRLEHLSLLLKWQ